MEDNLITSLFTTILERLDKLEQVAGLTVHVDEIEPQYTHTETGLFCATHKQLMKYHKRKDGCHIIFGNFTRTWLPENEIQRC